MTDASSLLLRALARAMAPGRQVLVCGASFEMLQLLAGQTVAELVVITPDADPDAPPGETVHGAPLRLRPDWAERARSKDLIIDESGEAPPEAVTRLLRKRGVYLSTHRTAVLDHLPESVELATEVGSSLLLTPAPGAQLARTLLDDAALPAGPSLYAAGKTPPVVPSAMCTHAGVATDPGDAETIARMEAALSEAEAALTEATALGPEVDTLRASLAEMTRATAGSKAELVALETEYEALRDEVAEKRFDDRRVARIEARYERAMAALLAELETLRAQAREFGESSSEAQSLATARDAAESETRSLLAQLAAGLAKLLPPDTLPATPGPGNSAANRAVLGAWLDAAMNAVDRQVVASVREAAARTAAEARVTELERALREAVTALSGHPPVSLPRLTLPASFSGDTDARVAQLEAALAAERGMRTADHARFEHAQRTAVAAVTARNALLDHLDAVWDAERAARLTGAFAQETTSRLEAELAQRAARETELEAMMTTHVHMEALLAEAVMEAEDARREADSIRRLGDENLRVLREEFERATTSDDGESDPPRDRVDAPASR